MIKSFLGTEYNGPIGASALQVFGGGAGGAVDTGRSGVFISVCTPGAKVYVHRHNGVLATKFLYYVPFGNALVVPLLGDEEVHVFGSQAAIAVVMQQVLVHAW